MPPRLLGLTWDQVHLVFSLQAALLMVGFLVQTKTPFTFGIGFWVMLLASITLVVAALMRIAATRRRPRLL